MTKGYYHHYIEEATGEPVEVVQRVSRLPTRLRVLRAERRLTLRQVADVTGVDKATLSGIERGTRHPQDRTLAKLAEAYDVPVEELLEEPTIIEIKGEPYPEEIDPELHEFNRITKEVAEAAKRYRYAERHPEIASQAYLVCKRQRLDEALGEYKKMVSGEGEG